MYRAALALSGRRFYWCLPRQAREVMSTILLLPEAGETFVLSSLPVWVRPLAIAVNMACLENGVFQ